MKYLICCFALVILGAFTRYIGAFDFSITTPDGKEQSLSAYQGKELMLVVLPATHNNSDSALLTLLDTLSVKYADSVIIIGIPSYEDGFNDDSLNTLLPWYQSLLGSNCVISGGTSTRKNSVYQTPLFSYLTHADQNGYFDDDVAGAGEKYFVDSAGNLYGISLPDADFDETVFVTMLNKSAH